MFYLLSFLLAAAVQSPSSKPAEAEGRDVGTEMLANVRVLESKVDGRSTRVAVGAIVAEEAMVLEGQRLVSEKPIVTGAPFRKTWPAGTPISSVFLEDREQRCLAPVRGTFVPPEDEAGEIYPGTCFRDEDGDGLFEIARFLPYRPDKANPREVAIKPVRFVPAPPGDHFLLKSVIGYRRLRIDHVDGSSARVVLEHAARYQNGPEPEFASSPGDEVVLALEEGAQAAIEGVTLRPEKSGEGWRIVTAGSFKPWMAPDEEGTGAIIGPFVLSRRR